MEEYELKKLIEEKNIEFTDIKEHLWIRKVKFGIRKIRIFNFRFRIL